MVRNEAPARAKAAGERQLPNDLSLPRQSSTLLAGRSGLVTKAVIAAQSLRISRASARTFSASSSRWSLQARFSRASIGLTMRAPVPSATSWIRPRISRSSHAPMWAPWGLRPALFPSWIRWARHLWPFLDQMGQTSLALLELAVGPVAVADQPAQKGVADQIADLITLARSDVEDGGGRGQHDPQPAQAAVLLPRRLVSMGHAGLAQIAEQILDDRLAGDTDLPDAAVERADRERHAEPDGQELADFGA